MGQVYEARDTRLHRAVALKILPFSLVANDERRRRFVQEAQLASALQHPHIVTIYDIGSAPAAPPDSLRESQIEYLAMELARGRTLREVIPSKGLRLNDALRYAIQIADALAAAHAAGVVHRDLKPGNIMVTDQGQIKILDFGLATLMPSGVTSDGETTKLQDDVVRTDAGTILGTVAYMSPEQAEGKPVDARSDLFSFGANLYEMLVGPARVPRGLDAGRARGGDQPRAGTARHARRPRAAGRRTRGQPVSAKRSRAADAARVGFEGRARRAAGGLDERRARCRGAALARPAPMARAGGRDRRRRARTARCRGVLVAPRDGARAAKLDWPPSSVQVSVSPDEHSVLLTKPDTSGTDLWLVKNFH